MIQQQNFDKRNNIRGRRFDQASLRTALDRVSAGQRLLTKLSLFLLFILVFFVTAILAGILGAVSGLDFSLRGESYLASQLMALVVAAWLATAIYQNLSKSLVTVVAGLGFALVIPSLLHQMGMMANPSSLPSIGFVIIAGWTVSCIIFCLIRLILASLDLLFKKPQLLKWIAIIFVLIGALGGSLIAIGSEDQPSSQVQVFAMFCGIGFGLALALGGWIANRLRGVPWNHPDLFRDWALAVGSWRGTSFYNLDLSGVNFRNARLANTDLRSRKLYRTCFQGATGLERARVDSRYLDLEIPKVQKLLTHGYCEDQDFSQLNLRGAYLQNTDMRHFDLIDTDLTGADLQGADLRDSILVRTQVIGVDFTEANLTGICIEDWSVNSQTCLTNVHCDYIYRKLDENGNPTDRYPADRNFDPREFESLYQEVGNVVELIFKEGVNWRAFSFMLQKLQLEDDGLGLELKGVEKRGDLWVVKVTHNQNYSRSEVEHRLSETYNEMKNLLAVKEQQINQLLGIVADQAEALKGYSKQSFGNSFFIIGSTITNLTGSGHIKYTEAADQVRHVVANSADPVQATTVVQNLLAQLQEKSVATTSQMQAELVEQILLTEAEKDPIFKQFLVQQGQQITSIMPESAIASAIRRAIATLNHHPDLT
jgi:uncharacterized protein YjbI with pentapeptide repeats